MHSLSLKFSVLTFSLKTVILVVNIPLEISDVVLNIVLFLWCGLVTLGKGWRRWRFIPDDISTGFPCGAGRRFRCGLTSIVVIFNLLQFRQSLVEFVDVASVHAELELVVG